MTIEDVRPTSRRRVYDLVSEAGIDTAPWANYSGNPAANPRYCYQWAFESDDVTVLNVWHKDVRQRSGALELQHNMREVASSDTEPVRRARAEEFDRAVGRASAEHRPVRLIVCDGAISSNGRSTRASKRFLDPNPWWIVRYSSTTGDFLLRRAASPTVPRPEAAALPEEMPASTHYYEGGGRTIVVNAYERNPNARMACLEHYGPRCCICDMSFEAVYGPTAAGYMHVHHVVPISSVGETYRVDPVNDLRPVCPNCHAVIHLGGNNRSLDEMRSLIGARRGGR